MFKIFVISKMSIQPVGGGLFDQEQKFLFFEYACKNGNRLDKHFTMSKIALRVRIARITFWTNRALDSIPIPSDTVSSSLAVLATATNV